MADFLLEACHGRGDDVGLLGYSTNESVGTDSDDHGQGLAFDCQTAIKDYVPTIERVVMSTVHLTLDLLRLPVDDGQFGLQPIAG